MPADRLYGQAEAPHTQPPPRPATTPEPPPPSSGGRPDLTGFRRAVLLRDRCVRAAVEHAARIGIRLTTVQARVAYDAMADLIQTDHTAGEDTTHAR